MTDTWKLSDATTWQQLKRAFSNRRIDFSTPGFFDSPAFLLAEASDPAFLVTYARFVESRPYDVGYLREARRRCVIASRILGTLVAEDGRLGACVDVSGMFARMLDCLGVWNYCAKATLTMEMKSGSANPRYYWVLDDGEFVAAHAFVVAPPFLIVDITLRYQPNLGPYADLLPQRVLSDSAMPAKWNPDDLANPEIQLFVASRYSSFEEYLRDKFKDMLDVMGRLPARMIDTGLITLKYVPVAVAATIEPLDKITGYKPCGRTANEIFTRDILPAIEQASGN